MTCAGHEGAMLALWFRLGPSVAVKGALNAAASDDFSDYNVLPTLWQQFLFQHDNVSMWVWCGGTALAHTEPSASVVDLSNALVCWMGANPWSQVPKSCGKTPRRLLQLHINTPSFEMRCCRLTYTVSAMMEYPYTCSHVL